LSSGASFSRPQDLLSAVLPDSSVLLVDKEENIVLHSKFAQEFGLAAARCNYGQTSLPDFTFLVSAAGSQTEKLFSVIGGNCRIATHLAAASNAKVKPHTIKAIHQSSGNSNKWTLTTTDSSDKNDDDDDVSSVEYDAVVIATPFERSDLQINGELIATKEENIKFKRIHVTFVKGILKKRGIANIFSCGSDEQGNPVGIINSVGLLVPVDMVEKDAFKKVDAAMRGEEAAWKVFSSERIANDKHGARSGGGGMKDVDVHPLLLPLFESITRVEQVAEFYAYPEYAFPPESTNHQLLNKDDKLSCFHDSFYPFVNHHNGVFSTCGIERTASAIEMALISGKNAALLVREHLLTTIANHDK
jgi:hypothetical protein